MIIASDCKDKNRPIFRKARNPIVEDLLDSYDNPGYELFDSPILDGKARARTFGNCLNL